MDARWGVGAKSRAGGRHRAATDWNEKQGEVKIYRVNAQNHINRDKTQVSDI